MLQCGGLKARWSDFSKFDFFYYYFPPPSAEILVSVGLKVKSRGDAANGEYLNIYSHLVLVERSVF